MQFNTFHQKCKVGFRASLMLTHQSWCLPVAPRATGPAQAPTDYALSLDLSIPEIYDSVEQCSTWSFVSGFFGLCSWGHTYVYSFITGIVLHCPDAAHRVYPCTAWWTFGSFPALGSFKYITMYRHILLFLLRKNRSTRISRTYGKAL